MLFLYIVYTRQDKYEYAQNKKIKRYVKMKEPINKKTLKEVGVLLVAAVMLLSTVIVSADTNDNRAVSLTICTKGSNHMIFGNERIISNEGTLIWDNGDPDGKNGLSCCYWPSYPLDREIVDDFGIDENIWVGGGHFRIITWHAHTAEFIDGVNVFFYEDIGDKPSIDRYAERVAEFDAYDTGNYYFGNPEIAIDVTFDIVWLTTGKWWVCFQPVLEDCGYWLTADGYGENIWGSFPDLGHPKWTNCYDLFDLKFDVSFRLFRGSPPPEKPQRPDGPTEGVIGVEYTFSTSTTDPEGENVSYLWDWGDGTTSEWTDFNDSGETVYASHIWTEVETYEIKVKAKDVYDVESGWSDPPLMIDILDVPLLEIGDITGGLFKISAVIKNNGSSNATSVDWSITLDGGGILLGGETTGRIINIPAGEEVTVRSDLICGLGRTVITVTVDSVTKEQDAFVFLFFIYTLD